MDKRKIFLNLFLIVFLIWSVGCQKAPTEKIESAQKELDKAAKEQADRYAPSDYSTAKETLNRARDENSKGNYNEAAQLAQDAERRAKAATDAADKNKKEMKDSVKKMIDDTRKSIDQSKEEYENARKLRVPEGDLAPAKSALASAETDLKQADDIIDSGDVITAREKVSAAQNRVMDALQDIRKLVAEKGAPHKKG